jgi:hypothetical protein
MAALAVDLLTGAEKTNLITGLRLVLVKLEPAFPSSELLLNCLAGGGPGGGASSPSFPQDRPIIAIKQRDRNLIVKVLNTVYKISVLMECG